MPRSCSPLLPPSTASEPRRIARRSIWLQGSTVRRCRRGAMRAQSRRHGSTRGRKRRSPCRKRVSDAWWSFAQMSNAFELREINVLDNSLRETNPQSNGSWRRAIRYPNVWTPAVQQAAATGLGRMFLGFSRFPAARAATDASGSTTVRFTDVRFVLGPAVADQPAPPVQLFTATIRLDAQGRIVSERLGR